MTTMTLIRSTQLDNGLVIAFYDGSNRYFGDYHRICIVVECRLAIEAALFAAASDPVAEVQKARAILGEQLLTTRTLERMGVAGEDLPRIREELIDSYLHNALPYLGQPDFPGRLLRKELVRRSPALSLVRR
jgi:hypothetical protein